MLGNMTNNLNEFIGFLVFECQFFFLLGQFGFQIFNLTWTSLQLLQTCL